MDLQLHKEVLVNSTRRVRLSNNPTVLHQLVEWVLAWVVPSLVDWLALLLDTPYRKRWKVTTVLVMPTLPQRNLEAMCLLTVPPNLTSEALTQAAVATLGATADRQVATTVGKQLSLNSLRIFPNEFSHSRNTCRDGFI
jgi:hypothetical protein